LMGSSYPGMDHYWREVSYENINLAGSAVVGWYNLPQPRSYYVYDRDGDGDADRDDRLKNRAKSPRLPLCKGKLTHTTTSRSATGTL
jgi:hypothetical protein